MQFLFSFFFFFTFRSIWKRSSKNYKTPKKKESITLGCGLIRKNLQFPRFPSFRFCPVPKIQNSEISESFILIKFLVVCKTQNQKYDLKEKTLILQCGLRRKNVHFQGFKAFNFAQYLKSKTWKPQKVFVYFNFLLFRLH